MSRLVYIALLLCTPIVAHAEVFITEIMYAPAGTDADHEWIEVCNDGSTAIDIENWSLFENDTNHSLEVSSGGASLGLGDCAVLADDAPTFLADYPIFSGNVLDSVFSLRNTGETLTLKNSDGEVVDTATYSDGDGASNDGNTLHRAGNSFVAGAPSPGSETAVGTGDNGTQASDSDEGAPKQEGGGVVTLYSYESVTIEPPEDVFLRVPEMMLTTVGARTTFKAESYSAIGSAVADGVVRWSFGDGGEAVGREVTHTFLYPGEYIVTATFERESLFDIQQIRVTAVALNASLYIEAHGEWVAIVNHSESQFDVSDWRLVAAGQYFNIPENTFIPADGEVRFPTTITKLSILTATQNATLVYPNGKRALEGIVEEEKDEEKVVTVEETIEASEVELTSKLSPNTRISGVMTRPAVSIVGESVPQSAAAVEPKDEQYLVAPQVDTDIQLEVATQTAAVILSGGDTRDGTNWYWYLGLIALVLVAAIGVLLVRPGKLIVDGFEVTEAKDE